LYFGGEIAGQRVQMFQRALGYLPVGDSVPPATAANFTPVSAAAYAESQLHGPDFVFTFGVRYDQFDPGSGARDATPAGIAAARAFLTLRFPSLADAPLLGSEVCQYEATPDSHFIIDRHPAAANVWIAGGGSGHGFKMGPAIGEMLASYVLGSVVPDPQFALARLTAAPAGGWEEKWS
jgi:glycine/D-amino acid oxidase-like deaminating enzyme